MIDRKGHILTNFHVIEGSQHIEVTLFNEQTYPAEVVGADPINDLAVIRIDAGSDELFPISLGDSENLRVGMRVFALGNPFGLDRTMSVGAISSLNRSLEVQPNWVIKSIIQIDAAINPGNSGGPLLNSHGELIGVNTAIATRLGGQFGQSAGIGFAIPASLVRRVVPELITHGRVIRGDIGITHVRETEFGLRIAKLRTDGPAERAGLQGPKVETRRRGILVFERTDYSQADIITAIDGNEVATASEFLEVIEQKKPGDSVILEILRGGRAATVEVVLGDEPF